MGRIAALPMYDLPELRSANDILWRSIAGHLRSGGLSGVPDALKRDESEDLDGLWRSPDLLLGQTCGYPLMTRLKGAVRVVALPHFGFSGCTGPLHRSVLIVPRASDAGSLADLRSTRCAVNGFDSNSGMNLLRAAVAPIAAGRPFFSAVLVTGAHVASLEAVAAGGADLAAIDCVTYGHLTRWR